MTGADAAVAAADAAALAAVGPCCVCGSPNWIAVSPGSGDADATLFDRGPEVPSRSWCADCWRARFLSADATARDVRKATPTCA